MSRGNGDRQAGVEYHGPPRNVIHVLVSKEWIAQHMMLPPKAIVDIHLCLEPGREGEIIVVLADPSFPVVPFNQKPPLTIMSFKHQFAAVSPLVRPAGG